MSSVLDTLASAPAVADGTDLPPTPDTLVGTHLDHFEVRRRIGQGGMGSVYEAWDGSLDRRVAIKVLRSELVRGKVQEERFLREARAQAKVNHPNIVQIHYIGHRRVGNDDSLFFAMELVSGESLEERIDRGECLAPEEARLFMMQAAHGLRAAQRGAIVHRDVKPSNLLLNNDGFLKIADFGLAKPMEGDVGITRDDMVVGSPLYMAPEQARQDRVDHRADMYALGASFHHALTGKPPFEGESPLAVLAQHLSSPPPKVRDRLKSVPRELGEIIDRLLAKSPSERFESYDALLEALDNASPQHTTYAGFWTRAAATILDSLFGGALIAVMGWPGLVLTLAYVVIGHAVWGQTLAKFFLRIRVTRLDGTPLGWWRSLIRSLASLWFPFLVGGSILYLQGAPELKEAIEQLSPDTPEQLRSLVVGVVVNYFVLSFLYAAGLTLAAFHRQKRAAHDLVVGSIVTYKLLASLVGSPSARAVTSSGSIPRPVIPSPGSGNLPPRPKESKKGS